MKRLLAASTVLVALASALLLPGPAAAGTALPEKSREAIFLLRHPSGLDSFVRAVSDPSSPRYRGYLSVEQMVKRFGASKDVRNQTLMWLASHGLHGSVGATETYVMASIPAGRVRRLLDPSASASASGGAFPATVPAGLRGAVTGVEVLGDGEAYKNVAAAPNAAAAKSAGQQYSSVRSHTGTAAGCRAGRVGPGDEHEPPFTPNQYLRAYGQAALHARGFEGQGQTVALVEIDGFHHSDIETFDRCFGVRTAPIRVVPVSPLNKPFPGGTETTLDLEVLTAAAPKLHRIYVYEGYPLEATVIDTAAAALGSKGHHPDVISISLGSCEPAYSGKLVYRRVLDDVFAIAGGAGISVLVASGDTGSSGCRVNTEEGTTALPIRTVSLPSSSPYATAVGGTNLNLTAKNRISSEIAWNDSPYLVGGGGGGVSLLSPRRPWWERLRQLQRFGLGRTVPDIAALADVFPGYAYFCTSPECRAFAQGSPGWTSIGGTSAATPLTAGGIALADQYAAAHGQPPLGFLNPLLYRLGASPESRHSTFTDVTKGDDDLGRLLPVDVGGGSPLGCCEALPGYDLATGWGSPKILALTRAASALAP
jgi:subtilase family serine protease